MNIHIRLGHYFQVVFELQRSTKIRNPGGSNRPYNQIWCKKCIIHTDCSNYYFDWVTLLFFYPELKGIHLLKNAKMQTSRVETGQSDRSFIFIQAQLTQLNDFWQLSNGRRLLWRSIENEATRMKTRGPCWHAVFFKHL